MRPCLPRCGVCWLRRSRGTGKRRLLLSAAHLHRMEAAAAHSHVRPTEMSLTRMVAALLFSLAAGAAQAQSAEPRPGESDVARADAHLRTHAGELLRRFGDTFYVLGVSIDVSGALAGHATREWPALQASPDEWTDSLVVELVDQRRGKRAVAYLADRWRVLDPVRADSMVAVFHFESANGLCVESHYPYAFLDDGSVKWGEPESAPCRLRVWTRA